MTETTNSKPGNGLSQTGGCILVIEISNLEFIYNPVFLVLVICYFPEKHNNHMPDII